MNKYTPRPSTLQEEIPLSDRVILAGFGVLFAPCLGIFLVCIIALATAVLS